MVGKYSTYYGRHKLISFIVVTFNRPAEINVSIKSIIGAINCGIQYEIIVVNNGDPLKLEPGIKTNLKVIEIGNNFGSNAAREIGIALAKSNLCLIFDDDDKVLKFPQLSYLKKIIQKYHIVHMGFKIDGKETVFEHGCTDNLFLENPFCFSGTCIDKTFFYLAGGFNHQMRSLQDWDLYLSFFDIGCRHQPMVIGDFINISTESNGRISASNSFSISFRKLVLYHSSFFLNRALNVRSFKDIVRFLKRLTFA